MRFKIHELTDTHALFEFTGVNYSFLNSLRRALVTMVPSMAIHEVDYHLGSLGSYVDEESGEEREFESLSAMFNEVLSHRLGMLPVPTDLELFKLRSECECGGEGCTNCTILYALHKQGPSTNTKPMVIYSGDLEPVNGDEALRISDDCIPLVKLDKGQAILAYARAELGYGSAHAKWQAVVAPRFYRAQVITIREGKAAEQLFELEPKESFKKSGETYELRDAVTNDKLITRMQPLLMDEKFTEAVSIKDDPDHYLFEFETNGNLSAQTALEKALEVLDAHFADFLAGVDAVA